MAWGDDIFPRAREAGQRRPHRRRARRRVPLGALLVLAVGGCGPPRLPYPEALQSEYPAQRVRAIKQAAQMRDHSVIGILTDRLEDEDEAVRFYAILALEKLTGTRLGYDYHASEALRTRAVRRWRRYGDRAGSGGVVADGGG